MAFKITPYGHDKNNTIKFVATLNGEFMVDIIGFAESGKAHVLTYNKNIIKNIPYFDKIIYYKQINSVLYNSFEFKLVDTPVSMFVSDTNIDTIIRKYYK